jgi:glycosyltransferase involved in cell wall biosynthesis
LKILIVSQHFWPESFRINDVADDLQSAGHEVTVLTGQPNYPGGRTFEGYRAWSTGAQCRGGVDVQRVPLVPRGRGSAARLVLNYLSFIASATLIGAWRLRGRRFDVVFVYATSPLLQALAAIALARMKHAALVTWVQDLWPQSLEVTGYVRNPRLLAAVARVVRWIYARNDLLLVPSRAFEAPVRSLAASVPLRYHPNPGDAAPASAGVPELVLPPGFNVVFAGNLGTAQALDTVLDAAQKVADLADLRLVLVGSGQRSAWLSEQVRERGLHNVLLPGRFGPEAMPGILAQASALLVSLVSSPAMSLTIPSKLQTYLATGRPVIAALDGEGARIVQEAGAGFACEAGNAQALADALRRVHALPAAERDDMGTAGKRYYAEHFSTQRLTQALAVHLQDAAQGQAARPATIRGSMETDE